MKAINKFENALGRARSFFRLYKHLKATSTHASLPPELAGELDELLRAALAFGVSALDRYIHDVTGQYFVELVKRPYDAIPKKLAEFSIPAAETERLIRIALESRKPVKTVADGVSSGSISTRPRVRFVQAFRQELNGSTYQSTSQMERAFELLSVKSMWNNILQQTRMSSAAELKKKHDAIIQRRNKIVHEGDIQHELKARRIRLNVVKYPRVVLDLDWIEGLVRAIDTEIDKQVKASRPTGRRGRPPRRSSPP